jgi:thioredoxin reductase (NADPH)
LILEKGCLANSIFSYPANMTFFTTRERLEIGDIPFSSINTKPTRAEALEYYRLAAAYFNLPIRFDSRVIAIESQDDAPAPTGLGRFRVISETASGRRAGYAASSVIVATGYYDLPNYLGIPGERLAKVSHYALEGHAFFGRKVAVIGGANSAAITALDLFRHGAQVTIVHWAPQLSRHIKYWIRPDIENRIREKSIAAHFDSRVAEIAEGCIKLVNAQGESTTLENDFVFALTGYHPDIDLLQRAGVQVDAVTYRPACDPKTLETNVPRLYVAGVVISGRHTNEIFIENGRFHGKQIMSDLAGKLSSRPAPHRVAATFPPSSR